MAAFTSKANGNWNAGGQSTWNEAGTPTTGDTVTITDDITLTQGEACGALDLQAAGSIIGQGFTLICTDDGASAIVCNLDGTITGLFDIELNGSVSRTFDLQGTNNIRNFTISGSGTFTSLAAFTLDADLHLNAGTLDTSGTDFDITCVNLTLTGTITANGSVITCSGDVDFSSGTFTHNSSTLKMTGTSKTVTVADGEQFFNLDILGTGTIDASSGSVDVINGFVINGAAARATIAAGSTLVLRGTNTTPIGLQNGGDFSSALTGTLYYAHTSNGVTVTIVVSDNVPNLTIDSNSNAANTYQLAGAVTCLNLTVGDGTNADTLKCNGEALGCADLTISNAGIIVADASVITASGDVDLSAGTFTHDSSTLVMSGTKNLIMDGNDSLNNFTISGAVTVSFINASSLNILGTFTNTGGGTFDIAGSKIIRIKNAPAITAFNNTGGTISGDGDLYFSNASATLDNFGTLQVNVRFESPTSASPTITLGASFTTTKNVIIASGTSGNFTLNTGGGSNYAVTCVDLTLDESAGSGTATLDCTASTSVITCSGDVDMTNGTFTKGTSDLTLTGTSKTLTLGANSNNFYDFTVSGTITTATAVTLTAGTFTNTGTLTVNAVILQFQENAIDNFDNSGGTIAGSGTLLFNGGSTASRTLDNFGTITINTVQVRSFSGTTTFNLGEALSITSSDLVMNSGGGTVVFDAVTYNISCKGLNVDSSVTLDGGSGTHTTTGHVVMTNGSYTQGSATFVVSGFAVNFEYGANSDNFWKLNVTAGTSCAFSATNNTLTINNTFTNTSPDCNFTIGTNFALLLNGDNAVTNWSNTGTVDAITGQIQWNCTGSVTLDNIGTIKGTCVFGSTGTVTLGGNFSTDDTVVISGSATVDAATFTFGCTDFTVNSGCTYDGGTNTTTCSGDVDMSAGTFTEGTSTLVMNGTTKVLTIGASSNSVNNLTLSTGAKTLAGATLLNVFGIFINSVTTTITTSTLRIRDITNFDNSSGTIAGANSLVFETGANSTLGSGTGGYGTITAPVLQQGVSGSSNTITLAYNLTLGDNYALLSTGGGTNTALTTATFDLDVTGTTLINSGTTIQTGTNAGTASWTFQDDVTVTGAMTATVGSGAGTFDINMTLAKNITCTGTMTLTGHVTNGDVQVLWPSANSGNDLVLNSGTFTCDYVTLDYTDAILFSGSTLDIEQITVTNTVQGFYFHTSTSTMTKFDNVSSTGTITIQSIVASTKIGNITNCTFNGSTADVKVNGSGTQLELTNCTLTNDKVEVDAGGVILDGDVSGANNDNMHVWGVVATSDMSTQLGLSKTLTVHNDDQGTPVVHGLFTNNVDALKLKRLEIETNSTFINNSGIDLFLCELFNQGTFTNNGIVHDCGTSFESGNILDMPNWIDGPLDLPQVME